MEGLDPDVQVDVLFSELTNFLLQLQFSGHAWIGHADLLLLLDGRGLGVDELLPEFLEHRPLIQQRLPLARRIAKALSCAVSSAASTLRQKRGPRLGLNALHQLPTEALQCVRPAGIAFLGQLVDLVAQTCDMSLGHVQLRFESEGFLLSRLQLMGGTLLIPELLGDRGLLHLTGLQLAFESYLLQTQLPELAARGLLPPAALLERGFLGLHALEVHLQLVVHGPQGGKLVHDLVCVTGLSLLRFELRGALLQLQLRVQLVAP
mmetsp:Transcript_27222/g.77878  ORF Transcript_27222/g.77878 Transcript_27222/m.77878 type:complete len:263 (-) Transcript_27222:931-1719(-)